MNANRGGTHIGADQGGVTVWCDDCHEIHSVESWSNKRIDKWMKEHHDECQARMVQAERVARLFHETYERLAPDYGYETRKDSAVAWKDVPKKNRDLMIATCAEVLEHL